MKENAIQANNTEGRQFSMVHTLMDHKMMYKSTDCRKLLLICFFYNNMEKYERNSPSLLY